MKDWGSSSHLAEKSEEKLQWRDARRRVPNFGARQTARAPPITAAVNHYKIVIKKLALAVPVLFYAQMFVRLNPTFVTGYVLLSLYAFGESVVLGQTVTADGMALPTPHNSQNVALVTQTDIVELEGVTVTGTFDVHPVEYPALPEVEGTKINSGKKTSFVKPEEFPAITNNDYREATATTPGILVSEEPSSPIINFGYRGLDSQRSEFMQILKDSVSIKNEQFGFPETHYTPILDAVERIEFVRGGAALQYGPQPGGALNFIMKMPRRDAPFHFVEKNAFGSDELYSNFTAFDGGLGPFGYYAYYDHREREGFRQANSDYEVDAGSARAVWDVTSDSRSEEHTSELQSPC